MSPGALRGGAAIVAAAAPPASVTPVSAGRPPAEGPRYGEVGMGVCTDEAGRMLSDYHASNESGIGACRGHCNRYAECAGYSWHPSDGTCSLYVRKPLASPPEGYTFFDAGGYAGGVDGLVSGVDGQQGFQCFRKLPAPPPPPAPPTAEWTDLGSGCCNF
ncbi:unnamed protein product [Prorocentrum cordatum]|uniref:Apple domain-containing protein n=1 Tax=Prorocentrum cordatum TaxID=2364126 RepID=A0ABN9UWF2_9DINO|nr:unnamed protein product [Polarella glacialis]CAK0864480.1 unnamed protein product [Polarella glacialis]